MDTTSVWTKNVSLPRFAKLNNDYHVDVAIIGAGITGITAAYLLKKAGCKVALIERGWCGGFDTSNTTAHLTCVTDARLHKLASRFGEDTARLVWDSGRAAIDQIFNIIREEKIRCDFAWVPAYLYAAEPKSQSDKNELQKDAALANKFGFPSEITETVPLVKRYGVKFLHQAKFNPLKYLKALLRVIPGRGSYVFENTEAEEVNDKPMAIKAGGHSIRCSYVVLATHTPLMGKTNLASATLFQSKLFLYTSYAVGAKIPRGFAEEASYWDTGEPYDYPLVQPNDYHGPEPRRYTYEGRDARYQGRAFKLGPKVVFSATDATVNEWRELYRAMYADGGWFARQSHYRLFLEEDRPMCQSENARNALKLEFADGLLDCSKAEMKRFLDGHVVSATTEKNQLNLAL